MKFRSHFFAVLGLSTFAVAQPVLNTVGHGATFFVSHGAGAMDVLSLVLVVFFVPPILFTTLAMCVGLAGDSAGKLSISFMQGVLASAVSMLYLSDLSALVCIPVALVLGIIVGGVYFQNAGFRELLRWVGISSPIVLIHFLVFTPVSSFFFSDAVYGETPKAQKGTPIVLLLFDELSLAAIATPDGQIDAGRLPNFSRLEQLSTWYSNTTTVSTATDRAVPALLTGLRPTQQKFPPIYSEFPRNLFSLFAPTHTISAVEDVTKLCPESACVNNMAKDHREFDVVAMYNDIWILWRYAVFPVELGHRYLPSIAAKWGGFGQRHVDDVDVFFSLAQEHSEHDNMVRFTDFVSQVRNSESRSLAYFHLSIPHTPRIYLPDGTQYNGESIRGATFTHWLEEKHPVDKAILRYSLQVEYADLLLGQVLDALEQSGRMEDAMLIVVSDHGTAFEPGEPLRVPIASTLAEVVRVPLFIKYPGQESGIEDNRKVETIDILPTIADVAQLRLDKPVDGQSLIAEDWQPTARHVVEAGNRISDFERSMNQRAASKRIYEVIDPGVTALGATGFGLAKKYTGKPVPVTEVFNNQLKLKITSPYCFQHVNKDIGFLPVYVTGVLEGAKKGYEVMIALNGIVAGSGMTVDDTNEVSVVLDPRKFIWWKNEVRAFSVMEKSVEEIPVTCGKEGEIRLSSQSSY